MRRLSIILLAAGNSSRFGENKLLYEIEGIPMYRYALETAFTCASQPQLKAQVILVTQYEKIRQQCEKTFGRREADGFQVIMNRSPQFGISYSLQLGLKAQKADDYLFMVCDQPWLKPETVQDFLKGYYESNSTLGCMAGANKLGNPAVFSSKWENQLRQLQGDAGGKQIIKKNLNQTYLFYVNNEKELQDVDKKENL